MNWNSIKRIIEAKTKDKINMPDWYYERLKKCIVCENNSANIDNLSLIDRLKGSHNFGKDFCNMCTCGIEDKSSDPYEQCPMKEPKWFARKSSKNEMLDLKITNENDLNFYYDKNLNHYIYNYGNLTFNQNSLIMIKINDTSIYENIIINSHCGCTTANKPTILKNEDDEVIGYVFSVEYDTKRIGQFNKGITITINDGKKLKSTYLKIKGNVKRK